jgi:hypothetical protein
MAKTSGLGDDLAVAGFRIGGDIQSLAIAGGNTPIDVTDITQSAHSRLGGVRAGSIKVVAYHDPAPLQSHAVYSPLPTTDQIVTYFRGQAIGNPAACCNSKQVDYNPTRTNTGALTFAVDAESNGFGLEWGLQLTAGFRTDTTATTGPFFDQGAGGTNGAQAYLQLVSFAGTSVDVTVQHATTSGGAYTTLIDFGAQTATGAFRGTAAGTVNEFLKVVTAGTFTSAVFAVVFMLNPVAVVF